MPLSMICHIPHASCVIPAQYTTNYPADLKRELLHMTDLYTDDLFDLPVPKVVFPISRLVCDVERFRDDEQEPMARLGMGAVYTVCHDLLPLRTITAEDREQILRQWYDPHHRRLTALARKQLQEFGRSTILDCHSFSPIPLPYELDQDPFRPDICIGTDPFHTPSALADALETAFGKRGYTVFRNCPYAGALVPMEYYQKDSHVHAVMIEVNRGLYMKQNGEKAASYETVRQDLQAVLTAVFAVFAG